LMMVGLKNIDTLNKRFSRRRTRKLQLSIVEFINNSVRNLDLVGRIEDGKFVAALLHTAGADARIPAERLLEKIKGFEGSPGSKKQVPAEFCFGIASYDQTMESEQDLLDKAKQALKRCVDGGDSIVYS
jgi:GGDEF domain-containing protein